MSDFKLTWRISPRIFGDSNKWKDFLRLIDKHGDVADEVALYISDDIYPELSPLEDKAKQSESAKACFKDLRARGCTGGINVWPTLNLYEIERVAYPQFRRMVGIDGEVIDSIACPTSKEFIKYMCEKYTIFAKSEPDFIWVDDDLRFTHMNGSYPCFCDDCVKNFKNGAYKSREELVKALEKKENRELRIAWSEYGADRLAKLCTALRAAVDKVNPNIDLGLMTVGSTHTTFSGNYIEKCMKALRSRRGRPGHDLYSDRALDKIMWKTLEAGRQVLEYSQTVTGIYWEEDSHPQGYLIKSFRTRRNETSLALMAGCTGIAFNHTGHDGGLFERFEREVDELHAARPRWEKFLEFSKGLSWAGMWPYYSWFLTAKADPDYAWLKELPFGEQNSDFNVSLPTKIGVFGVPLTADRKNACATLLSGRTLTAMTDEELKEVFSKNVYMDASALAALEDRGLSRLAGVKLNPIKYSRTPLSMTDHNFNGEFAEYTYRISDTNVDTLLPLEDSVEWLGYRHDKTGEGDLCQISKYENMLGGKVIVNAYEAWEFTDTPANIYQIASIAEWFDAPVRLRYANNYHVSRVQPYIRTNGEKAAVMLLNASLDTTNPFEIIVKGNMTQAVLLNADGSETKLTCHREDGCLCVDVPTIDIWDIAFILLK